MDGLAGSVIQPQYYKYYKYNIKMFVFIETNV
jgi:hypothetical protein